MTRTNASNAIPTTAPTRPPTRAAIFKSLDLSLLTEAVSVGLGEPDTRPVSDSVDMKGLDERGE